METCLVLSLKKLRGEKRNKGKVESGYLDFGTSSSYGLSSLSLKILPVSFIDSYIKPPNTHL